MFAQIPQEGLQAFYPFNGNTLRMKAEMVITHLLSEQHLEMIELAKADMRCILEMLKQLILPIQELTPFIGDCSISIWFKTPNQTRSHLIELGYWIGGDGDGGNFQITLLSGGTVWAYWNGFGENAMISQAGCSCE
jgi:hypothetical protein